MVLIKKIDTGSTQLDMWQIFPSSVNDNEVGIVENNYDVLAGEIK